MSHYNLVHKFVPMPQAMKIPDAKAAVDKELKSSRPFQHGFGKNQEQEEVILEAQRDINKVYFASLMDICHLKKAELDHNCISRKAESCSRRHCKGRLWSPRSLH